MLGTQLNRFAVDFAPLVKMPAFAAFILSIYIVTNK